MSSPTAPLTCAILLKVRCFQSIFYLLVWEREREADRQTDRRKYWFVVLLIYAFIGSFLHVAWLEIKPTTLMRGDDAATSRVTRPGQEWDFWRQAPRLANCVADSDIPQEGESFSEVKCDFLATTLQSVHSDILFYAYFGQGENKGLSAFRKVSVNPTFSWIEHMNLFFLSHKTLLQGPFKIPEPLFLVPHCSFLHI